MMLERPLLLIAAAIITVTVVLLARWARARRIAAAAGWSAELGRAARLHGIRSPWLLGAVALLAGIGLTGPRWGLAERVTESRALNVVLVMDISRSMLAQDVAPDRLTRALGIARRLVQDLDGDRLGLIAFAARPYLLAPLTLDQSALTLQLDALDPEVASEGGSAQGAALVQARTVLDGAIEGGDKVVVMLTDGESFEGEDVMLSAASSLRSAGITLVVVPVGTPDGSRIPAADGGWHLDGNGVEVITRRRDDLLTPLVAAAEGVLIAADSPDPTGDVRRALSRLERAEARDRAAADLVPRAWLFALGAALVLGVQTVTRRSAALAGLLLLLGGGTASAQRPSAGSALLQRGDTAAAGAAFLEEARRRGTDTAWFNAGTAALVQGDFAAARDALERASTSLDPDLRRRALYNLGTGLLLQSRQDSTGRDSLVTAAASHLRSALQLDPGDRAAKFNYELARRQQPPPPPPSPQGGGGGGGGGDGPPPPDPQGGGGGGMSQAEAEQVLGAMERAERATRQELARRQRRGQPPAGPDW
jgi:Ca-activated chloride channel family protein